MTTEEARQKEWQQVRQQEREEARQVLRNKHKVLVLVALSYVNLTDRELDILILRHMRGHSQEDVANQFNYSTNGLQKIEYKALDKCYGVWHNMCFIQEMLMLDEQAEM